MSDLTNIFTDPAPAELPPPCGILDQCECGMCATAHAAIIAELGPLETPVDCRTCNGERMIDASDSTPNEYLIPCPSCCPDEQRITGPTR